MAYAKVDNNNRIIEWSYDKLDHLNMEFSNGEYVDEVCNNGVQDFIIENGKAVYSPIAAEPEPTELDVLEAQVTYTAMMTDTLLEV